ncbi:hypothetical protein SAMN05421788_102348 [Filimonas lacunae]|uniref:Uncharacterized protein n=1 Tax=Filimonas lacunae TaxID=477680 RepID=A0A173MHX1_9BACT|nr:hypothetical protein [Filimonas lacunae]BAV07021.1 hypothetical protein FLA_3041 [Filimonas lacunae]SIS96210.1 hypothetical protein SAMN05421788_102348 [Filimonas lacunae]
MKKISLLVILMMATQSGITQKATLDKPLPSAAFTRMIVQDITYAVVGESTPVSGVKVDVSKPEGTISGMFPTKDKWWNPFDIIGFELKGGVTDRNFSFFKGGFSTGNSAYEIKPSFHRITWCNSAKYGTKTESHPKLQLLHAKNTLATEYKARVIDTVFVITSLYNLHLKVLGQPKKLPKEVKSIKDSHRAIAAYFIPKIIKQSGLTIDTSGKTWGQILNYLPEADTVIKGSKGEGAIIIDTYYDEVTVLYKKYEKVYSGLYEETLDKMIVNSSSIWTKKKYLWWTFSPFFRSDKANEYYTKYDDIDSMYFKSDYRFSYGASAYLNRYCVTPNKFAILARLGATISHTNNLGNLTPYNYENKTPFFEYAPSVTEKVVAGSAYNNSDIKTGLEKQLAIELYILPLGSLIPGLYLSGTIGQSDLYKLPKVVGRADDTFKAGAEGGFIFNINNRDKDKTLLSIITYFKYADFTDKQRTSLATGIEESKSDFEKRNISIGLKVGIPITLPKKTE